LLFCIKHKQRTNNVIVKERKWRQGYATKRSNR
jgi:hypothetical protein